MKITEEGLAKMIVCLLIVVVIGIAGYLLYAFLNILPMTVVVEDVPAQCIGRGC